MLGTDLVVELTRRGHEVACPSKADLDITDPMSVARLAAGDLGGHDWCFNCAAYTAVDKAEDEIDTAIALNSLGPGYLAKACAMAGIRLVHMSTDFVFDGDAAEPYSEEHSTNPLSTYAVTKRDGEEAVLANPEAVVVRTAWLYGSSGNCFPKTIIKAWLAGKSLRVVSDQVGSPTFSADLAGVLVDCLEKDLSPGIYHAAGSDVMSWQALALLACETYARVHQIGGSVEIEAITTADWPTPARRPRFSALSSAKLASLGIGPMRAVEEAMSEFVGRISLH